MPKIKKTLKNKKKPTSRKKVKVDKNKANRIIDIYKVDSGEKVDMTKLERKKYSNKGKIIFFLFLFLFILAAAAVAGFLFFNKDFTDKKTESEVELKIETVNEIASGEKIELEIIYENKDAFAIKEGNITVHYPDGFYLQSASPQADISDNSWNISDIAAGMGGKIKITGQIVGELQEEKEFTSFLTYKPINFNSDFQNTAVKKVKINKSIVSLKTSVAEIIFSGQEIEYKVNFKNLSSLPLPNVKVNIDYPEAFSSITTEPAADLNNNIWKFEELAPGQEKDIKIKGIITGESRQTKEFKFKLGLEEPDGLFNLQVEKANTLLVVNPAIELSLEAPEFIAADQEIEYKIVVTNTSDIAIKELELNLNLTEDFFDKKNIALDKIETLKAGDKKEFTKKITLSKNFPKNKSELKSILSINKAKVEEEEFEFEKTAEAISKIKGELVTKVEARYYSDDLSKIGSGPIPPKVGETTSYVVYWQIEAKGGDLKNVNLTTSLADYVDGVEVDKKIEYNKNNNQVNWTIDKLDKNESKQGNFTVFITPTKEENNKLLVITKQTVVSATDSNTQENFSETIEKLTSDLPADPAATGKGVVEK